MYPTNPDRYKYIQMHPNIAKVSKHIQTYPGMVESTQNINCHRAHPNPPRPTFKYVGAPNKYTRET